MSSKSAKSPMVDQSSKVISSQSGKPQPELYLNDLDLGVTGTIVVMLCRMWDVNSTTGRYLSTDFIVSDAKGYAMHCSAKAHVAHNFLKLKEGCIYSIRNFAVVPNKDEYRLLKNAECMLEFDGTTTVRRSYNSSEGFDRYPFQLVAIDNLEPTNNQYLIDAVGYVTNVGRATQQKTGSRTLDFYRLCYKRWACNSAEDSGQSVRVTLWGALGDALIEKRTAHVGLYPVVLTALNVKEYNNRLYLSSTSSTLILDDVKIPAVSRLKTDDKGVERTKESLPVDHTEPKDGTLENLLMWARNRKYDTATFHCLVKIDNVRTKKGWNYPSCGGDKCRKGMVNRKGGQFWCDSCNKAVKYPVLRYRLELEVSDETAHVVVVMFDEPAAGLVKCSADSILELDDQEAEEHPDLPQP